MIARARVATLLSHSDALDADFDDDAHGMTFASTPLAELWVILMNCMLPVKTKSLGIFTKVGSLG